MARKKTTDSPATGAASREGRLKAALKANLARRKAQSRGRAAQRVQDLADVAEQEQDKDA